MSNLKKKALFSTFTRLTFNFGTYKSKNVKNMTYLVFFRLISIRELIKLDKKTMFLFRNVLGSFSQQSFSNHQLNSLLHSI